MWRGDRGVVVGLLFAGLLTFVIFVALVALVAGVALVEEFEGRAEVVEGVLKGSWRVGGED